MSISKPDLSTLGAEGRRAVDRAKTSARNSARTAAQRADGYVDEASSSMGRALQSTAQGLENRAASASASMSRAGRYLEQSRPADMGRDFGAFIRRHPEVPLGVGFGLGLLVGRALANAK